MRNIWSSLKLLLSSVLSSWKDVRSRPNGFSTITRFQPVALLADSDAHAATSVKIDGGMDR